MVSTTKIEVDRAKHKAKEQDDQIDALQQQLSQASIDAQQVNREQKEKESELRNQLSSL